MNPKHDRERRKKLRRRAKLQRKHYKNYFKSKKWKQFRSRILHQRGYKCERCPSRKRLTVHHMNYKNFRHEKDEDVLVLCWSCHQKAHGRPSDYDYKKHNRAWKKIQ